MCIEKEMEFDFASLFESLESVISEETIIEEPAKKVFECCDNQSLITYQNEGTIVCKNCGRCYTDNVEYIEIPSYKNPKFQLSTSIGFSSNPRHRTLVRLHNWNNYDYKENTANKSYKEIETLGKLMKLDHKTIEKANCYYKIIYIDNDTSSRNKIKKCIYIYCLYKASNFEIDVISVLKENKLSINNFNKALLKIEDEEKLFLHNKMERFQNIFSTNYTEISIIDIIQKYNIYNEIVNSNNLKINNNTILLASFFWYIKEQEDFMFETLFKTTTLTINEKMRKIYKF